MRKIMMALAAASLATAAQAVTVVNGSFENGIDPGSFTTLFAGDTTSIPGWTIEPDGVDYIGTYWAASDGNRSLDMSALTSGQIMQTLTGLTAGKMYRIGFDMSANPDGGSNVKRLTVSATGGVPQTFLYTRVPGQSASNMLWQHYTYTFVASSASQNLSFLSQNNDPSGPALDNVTISAIPEPAMWGMMLLGFGMVGVAARRRHTVTSLSA